MNRTEMKKAKILYMMHVDWHWIKQRPHFLAEELSEKYDVIVLYPRAFRRDGLSQNVTQIKKFGIIQLPFARWSVVEHANQWLKRLCCLAAYIVFRPDYLWVTFPGGKPREIWALLPSARIIYDCMDDAAEFASCAVRRSEIMDAEVRLLRRAHRVLVSSQNLYEKLIMRGRSRDLITLVRNAFNGPRIAAISQRELRSDRLRVLYIGTVGEYLDFGIIHACVERIPNVEFHFIGPVRTTVPQHDRIYFHGSVDHSCLEERVREFDCFIMPFQINELILSVDPVKLYEYINFNKNIISVFYPEIERFSRFVHFYKCLDDFVDIIDRLLSNNSLRYDEKQRADFLDENSWSHRAGIVENLINNDMVQLPC